VVPPWLADDARGGGVRRQAMLSGFRVRKKRRGERDRGQVRDPREPHPLFLFNYCNNSIFKPKFVMAQSRLGLKRPEPAF